MRKKALSIMMAATMMAGLLAGCGGAASSDGGSKEESAEGKVLNVWCWNEEFQSRFNDYYPEVKEVAKDKSTTTLNDGTVVKWTVEPNQDSNYQNKLDAALEAQESAADDDKIDIFLVEADYAQKYTSAEAGVTLTMDEVGLTKDELADQYQYTKDVVTDENGEQRGTSWQAAPGLFVYRRSIAKDVLGTDDPEKVQAELADMDKFNAVAEKMSGKGYKMLSGYDDAYRIFSNNVSTKWVDGTKCVVDPEIMNWVDMTKDYTDKDYNNKTTLWSDEWSSDQGAKAKVFGFFYSTWGINFTLVGNAGEEGKGDWATCEGPKPYYWGGTWICAAAGTDNVNTVKDVMVKLTCDKDIMKSMTENQEIQDYTNTQTGMKEIADSDFSSDFLGGQNHIALFSSVAPTIDASNCSAYDQGCNEKFQAAFKDYFDGNVTKDKAKENFEKSIKEIYPEITEVVWPK